MSASTARALFNPIAAAVLLAALLLPAGALAAPARVVVIDQIRCRTVRGPAGNKTVCTIQRQQKRQQARQQQRQRGRRPSRIQIPDTPPLAQAPLQRAPSSPFIDLDHELDIPPPLTDKDLPAPLPEPRHEAELPGALRELPAPMRSAPAAPPLAPAPRLSSPGPRLDDHGQPPRPRRTPRHRTPDPGAARRDDRSAALTVQESQVFTLLNTERRRRGLAPLRVDPRAAAVARAHSRDMCERRFFSHDNPDGKHPWDRLRAGGVRFSAAAENIAVGYSSGYAAHQGWLASPGHRANRLSPVYSRMGVGLYICPGSVSMPYWTEVFVK